MAGEKWSEEELEILLNGRLSGLSGREILEFLPNRSLYSLAQIVRRNKWADPELSKKMKEAVQLNGDRHQLFVEFLKKNSTAPIEQITDSWNSWASLRNLPTIKAGRVYYWIEKLALPHSRSEVWNSKYAQNNRKEKRKKKYPEKFKEFQREVANELDRRKKCSIKYLKKVGRDRSVECVTCRCCDNRWPLTDTFFSKLPSSFSFRGRRLDDFQAGFCLFCDWRVRSELSLKRAFKIDVENLLESRRYFRRFGFDRAFSKAKENARNQRDQALKTGINPNKLKVCSRCSEVWPANKNFFRANPKKANGRSSLRGICTFCDHYFETAIDRRKRDRLSYSDLAEERSKYLKIARNQF